MKAKRRVLKAWPNAYSHSWACSWTIYSGELVNIALGEGHTPALAWADAYRKYGKMK